MKYFTNLIEIEIEITLQKFDKDDHMRHNKLLLKKFDEKVLYL